MKTAVSVPDEIFKDVERLARSPRKSRSEVYSDALKEYVARHEPDEITKAMDRMCQRIKDEKDAFVAAATSLVLEHADCDFAWMSGGPIFHRRRGRTRTGWSADH